LLTANYQPDIIFTNSFIPTVPPSFPGLRLGKWLRKLM